MKKSSPTHFCQMPFCFIVFQVRREEKEGIFLLLSTCSLSKTNLIHKNGWTSVSLSYLPPPRGYLLTVLAKILPMLVSLTPRFSYLHSPILLVSTTVLVIESCRVFLWSEVIFCKHGLSCGDVEGLCFLCECPWLELHFQLFWCFPCCDCRAPVKNVTI